MKGIDVVMEGVVVDVVRNGIDYTVFGVEQAGKREELILTETRCLADEFIEAKEHTAFIKIPGIGYGYLGNIRSHPCCNRRDQLRRHSCHKHDLHVDTRMLLFKTLFNMIPPE